MPALLAPIAILPGMTLRYAHPAHECIQIEVMAVFREGNLEGGTMRGLSRGARVPGAIALMLLACGAVGQGFVYGPANDPLAEARSAPPVTTAPQLPYSAIGYFEEGGVRMAVLAHGDLILLKKQGDDVGSDFRLVVVDPPALLHLPTGMLLQVRRQGEAAAASGVAPNVAALHASDPIIAHAPQSVAPIETTSAAEFEAALARALAAR